MSSVVSSEIEGDPFHELDGVTNFQEEINQVNLLKIMLCLGVY